MSHRTSSPCGLFSPAEGKVKLSDDVIDKIGSMRYANVRFWGSAEYLMGL